MMALTARQGQLLDFLKAYHAEHDRMPSFDEMLVGVGLASKSGIHRLLCGLEERGFIRRMRDRARAIEILPEPHLPDSTTLTTFSTAEIAKEVRRRGLCIGHIHRESYRVGDKLREYRTFQEVYS